MYIVANLYTNLSLTAASLLETYGQLVTLSRTTGSVFDPVLGKNNGGKTTSFTGYGAVFNYATSQINNGMIERNDRK